MEGIYNQASIIPPPHSHMFYPSHSTFEALLTLLFSKQAVLFLGFT